MNIEEMHIMFRELAQQMGMQTTRAILSENIDICLNVAIKDLVKELITEHIGYINPTDKVSRHNSAISPINGLRTLTRKSTITAENITGNGTLIEPYTFNISNDDVMIYFAFKVIYNSNLLYDCRIIEHEDLGQTVHDFCNRPAKDTPICTIVGDAEKITVNLINGLKVGTKPKSVDYLYIANPTEVYFEDIQSPNNVDCDMPDYLHNDIVKKAISVYVQSIGGLRSTNK